MTARLILFWQEELGWALVLLNPREGPFKPLGDIDFQNRIAAGGKAWCRLISTKTDGWLAFTHAGAAIGLWRNVEGKNWASGAASLAGRRLGHCGD
jgi:hypothetical protein